MRELTEEVIGVLAVLTSVQRAWTTFFLLSAFAFLFRSGLPWHCLVKRLQAVVRHPFTIVRPRPDASSTLAAFEGFQKFRTNADSSRKTGHNLFVCRTRNATPP